MPVENDQWQDWTRESYAATDEWQRYMDQQLAMARERVAKMDPLMRRTSGAFLLETLEGRRAQGPGAEELAGFNTAGRTSWGSSPEQALKEYGELGDVPEMEAPSMEMLRRYQLGAMDVPARGAALQSGAASQRLGGLNPAARSQALSEISRGGSGMVGMGAGGGGGGWGGMAQQAALTSYQGQMRERGMLGNAIQQSIGQGYSMDQLNLQHQNAMERARYQYEMQRKQRQRSGGFWGAMSGIAGTAMGGPFGGAVGGWLGNQFGGGGRSQYDYSSPMGGQQHQYASPGYR